MDPYVLYFNQIDKSSLPYVGGKGANLGEMTKADLPIPQGFCVTTSAYRTFVAASKEMQKLFDRLDQVPPDDLNGIRETGKHIREHLESIAMPDGVKRSILEAWQHYGQEKANAVRSSATAEDLPTASFAGQQETYLNVEGREPLLQSVKKCWASLFTDRAIVYRAKNGFDHRSVFLSVVVQEMIAPHVSGIMFTADPITGNRNITSIDASFGLGEALVSGLVSADLYQVCSNEIIKKQISKKKAAIYSVKGGGTITKDLPPKKQEAQALPDGKIVELASLGQKIEDHYGEEQDIEWGMADGKFYILQSRPITSLYPVPKIPDEDFHVMISFGHQQMMTDAMSPLGLSIWRTLFPFGKPGSVRTESQNLLEAGGRLFIDPTPLLSMKPGRKMIPKVLRNIDERIGNAVAEVVERKDFRQPVRKGVKGKLLKTAGPIAIRVINLLFFRNPEKNLWHVNAFMEKILEESEDFLRDVSGAEHIRRIQQNTGQLFSVLLKEVFPYPASGIFALNLVQKLSKKWLGESPNNLYRINQSLAGNVTTELGLFIGDLADLARPYPGLIRYLEHAKDEDFFENLEQINGGPEFSQKLNAFMDRYGMRCPGEIDIANLRWRESPTRLVPSILGHIRSVEPERHRKKFRAGEQEARQAAQELLAKIRQRPGGFWKARLLSRLIKVFRSGMALREHPKYIIIRHLNLYKKAILDEGQRFSDKGILSQKEDVFYLRLEELLALAEDRFSEDVPHLVKLRKKQYQQNQERTPPRVMTSEGEEITGRRQGVDVPEGALAGSPVSSGIAEGYAKVVLKPEEADLNAGEIMIAPFTDPGWTPLFHSAKALVMEVGGMMTHGAVVAREYGIPAIVGIDKATELIKDGDYIRVNGTLGFVEKLKENTNKRRISE